MKKYITSFMLILVLNTAFSQATNKIDTIGNIGIGTSTPAAKLDVVGDVYMGTSTVGSNLGLRGKTDLSYNWDVTTRTYSGLHFGSDGGGDVTFLDNGNVGIGTTIPAAKLDVAGDAYLGTSTVGINLGLLGKTGVSYSWNISTRTSNGLHFSSDGGGDVTFLDNGSVGIGTTSPTEKLSVNGYISAKKVIVTQSGWSDYVFGKDYTLKSLSSLEKYINDNNHLPGIPSAKEVKEKGIDLGDTQALLLKKIEELTLYIINQQKTIQQQEGRIRKLEKN